MSEIIDVVEPSVPGPQGKGGTINSATAKGLAAGAQPTVKLGGTPEERTIEFGLPKGDKGDKGDKGEIGLTGDGSIDSVNGHRGPDVTLTATDVGGSFAAESGSIPMRGDGGRVPGVGAPVARGDAAPKGYVDEKLESSLASAATIDELVFAVRFDAGYEQKAAIVEFTNTTAFTVMVAPFDMEVTSFVLAFERYSIPAHQADYVRSWVQRFRPGVANVPMTSQKNTSTGSGGQEILARVPWSLSDGGWLTSTLKKGDMLSLAIGVTGAPKPVQFPFTATVQYRPI